MGKLEAFQDTLIAHTIAETIKAGVSAIERLEKDFEVQSDGQYHFGENQKTIGFNQALTTAVTALQGIVNEKMNAQPSSYPTTSDISQFMQRLGYKWSNEAQVYYETGNYDGHITRRTAEKMYRRVIGNNPFLGEVYTPHYKR